MTPFTRDIADYPGGIVLPIDKPFRWTSADVVRKVKFAAKKHFGKKNLKVGHAGTLDPLATGILLICIGDACKRAQLLQDSSKEYVATIRFGATTPSYDLEKDVDRTFPFAHITASAVEEALKGFIGTQEQVAPLFSAKSVDGVRAYELARKLYRKGETDKLDEVSMSLLQRNTIVISSLELLDFKPSLRAAKESLRGVSVSVAEESLRGVSVSVAKKSSGNTSPLRDNATVSGQNVFDNRSGQNFSDLFSGGKVLVREGEDVLSGSTASSRINLADTSGMGLPEATVRIACSKGTYIRAFARDLGEALGSGAHLAALQRTLCGGYRMEDALCLDEVLEAL